MRYPPDKRDAKECYTDMDPKLAFQDRLEDTLPEVQTIGKRPPERSIQLEAYPLYIPL